MKISFVSILALVTAAFLTSGCDKFNFGTKQSNALGNRPDLDCIVANDFYAIHFSAYIQPDKLDKTTDPKAAFVPYCQKIPHPGKMFFTADLIDRDIRTTPIGIRLVEVEKTDQPAPNDFRELRTVAEIESKLYPRGAVEAQANIDKNGDYLLYFLIGDAIEEDDKFRVPLAIGVDPNSIPLHQIALISGLSLVAISAGILIFLRIRNRRQNQSHNG